MLKGLATEVRTKGTDVVDLWRYLAVGFAAGINSDDFEGEIPERSVNSIRGIFLPVLRWRRQVGGRPSTSCTTGTSGIGGDGRRDSSRPAGPSEAR